MKLQPESFATLELKHESAANTLSDEGAFQAPMSACHHHIHTQPHTLTHARHTHAYPQTPLHTFTHHTFHMVEHLRVMQSESFSILSQIGLCPKNLEASLTTKKSAPPKWLFSFLGKKWKVRLNRQRRTRPFERWALTLLSSAISTYVTQSENALVKIFQNMGWKKVSKPSLKGLWMRFFKKFVFELFRYLRILYFKKSDYHQLLCV